MSLIRRNLPAAAAGSLFRYRRTVVLDLGFRRRFHCLGSTFFTAFFLAWPVLLSDWPACRTTRLVVRFLLEFIFIGRLRLLFLLGRFFTVFHQARQRGFVGLLLWRTCFPASPLSPSVFFTVPVTFLMVPLEIPDIPCPGRKRRMPPPQRIVRRWNVLS